MATQDSHPLAATFYSSTALSMETLKLAPGMYDLMPTKSPEGWKLEVARWSDAPSPQKYLGSVEMNGAAPDNLDKKNYLQISMWPWAARCSNLTQYLNFWELHFITFYIRKQRPIRVRPSGPTAPRSTRERKRTTLAQRFQTTFGR
jgi:hypothetical protein